MQEVSSFPTIPEQTADEQLCLPDFRAVHPRLSCEHPILDLTHFQ